MLWSVLYECLAAFMDVCDVVIKAQFIVQDDAEALKALHHVHWLAVDGMRGGEFIVSVLVMELIFDAHSKPTSPQDSNEYKK